MKKIALSIMMIAGLTVAVSAQTTKEQTQQVEKKEVSVEKVEAVEISKKATYKVAPATMIETPVYKKATISKEAVKMEQDAVIVEEKKKAPAVATEENNSSK